MDPTFTFEHVVFNVDPTYQGQPNPLSEARVHQALALVVDKPKVIQDALSVRSSIVKDLEAWTPWIITPKLAASVADPKIVGQWDPIARRFITDTGRGMALVDARKLLASTLWKQGFALDFVLVADNLGRRVEERDTAADWSRLGVKLNPIFVPPISSTTGITVARCGTELSRPPSLRIWEAPTRTTSASHCRAGTSTVSSRYIIRATGI